MLILSAEASPPQLKTRIFKWLRDAHPALLDFIPFYMNMELLCRGSPTLFQITAVKAFGLHGAGPSDREDFLNCYFFNVFYVLLKDAANVDANKSRLSVCSCP